MALDLISIITRVNAVIKTTAGKRIQLSILTFGDVSVQINQLFHNNKIADFIYYIFCKITAKILLSYFKQSLYYTIYIDYLY